jgi:hypothetical protein
MIFFEIDGRGYAVDASELAGVAGGCPFVTYPGLPAGVLGLAQWSGKVFPIIDPLGAERVPSGASTFLFSLDNLRAPFKEVALVLPGPVRVFFADSTFPAPEGSPPIVVAKLVDADGNEALQLKLSKIVEGVAARMETQRRRGGRGVAA